MCYDVYCVCLFCVFVFACVCLHVCLLVCSFVCECFFVCMCHISLPTLWGIHSHAHTAALRPVAVYTRHRLMQSDTLAKLPSTSINADNMPTSCYRASFVLETEEPLSPTLSPPPPSTHSKPINTVL